MYLVANFDLNQVIWHVDANHAGGYSYRLCKVAHNRLQDVTEECFQAKSITFHDNNLSSFLCSQEMPLNFVGDKQWVVYKKDYHSERRTKVLVLF